MSYRVIADAILASLRAQGLTVVRIADTTYGSDETDRAFARDCAANAAMIIAEPDTLVVDEPRTWRPSDLNDAIAEGERNADEFTRRTASMERLP